MDRSADLLSLYESALKSADPRDVTARAIEQLQIPRHCRVWLFAIGKAAEPMAAAAAETLLRSLHQIVGGVMVTPEGGRSPYPTVVSVRGDHPVPGANSERAAEVIGDVAKGRRASDVVIVLVSGGASSLVAAPLRDQKSAELFALYQAMLSGGVDIGSMNLIRKRFSRWGGGRLALALAPAAVHCFAVSDVPGDDIAIIGSGPCVPDPSTAQNILNLLGTLKLPSVAPAFRDYLLNVTRGVAPETPKANHPAFAHVTSSVISSNRRAVEGIAAAALAAGMKVDVVEDLLHGPAHVAGDAVGKKLLTLAATRNGAPRCVIWGGETTVAANGAPATAGGRCQELALATAEVLSGAGELAQGIRFLAAGTDGRDGQTDAAGAIVDGSTWKTIRAAGADPVAALRRHESGGALALASALVPRRQTGTNVMDVAIGIID